MLHLLYGQLARARRGWYERRPQARRRLERPVISIGNLSVGGTGKTPLVAALARWLVAEGERPAILSRGYARRTRTPEPTVVSDGSRLLADVSAAGDEPLMLARAVPGARVVVGADRHASGRHAETALGATVHLLDDGFQHVQLHRDLDIVVTPAGALAADHVLPKGRLREPVGTLDRAGLLVVVGADDAAATAEAARFGVAHAVGATRRLETPVALSGGEPPAAARVVAMAGIGDPAQFAAALAAQGWQVAAMRPFPDHHWFTPADLAAVARTVAEHGAWGVLTTDKDAVRLEPLGPLPCRVARVPMALDIPQWATIAAQVRAAIAAARAAREART
ncbi:MAG: tetraacyldisaccharide 4'-kinase [Vicinamibacterales bacterium]